MSDKPAYPPERQGWLTVGILALLTTLSVIDRNILSLLVNPIQADLQLSETQMGTLMGFAFGIFFFIGALPIGWAMDRYSRPLVIWFGVTVWSLGTMACGLANSFWAFFAGRSLVGAGEATMGPGSQSLLPDFFPPRKLGFALSVYATGTKIGAGLSFAIGGALAALIDPSVPHDLLGVMTIRGWQLIFLLLGVPGILIGFVIFLVPDPRRNKAVRRENTTFATYFKTARRHWRFIVPHHLGLMLVALSAVAIQAWGPAFFERTHGLSAGQVGPALGLGITLGTIVGLPLHGKIVDFLYSRGMADAHVRYMAISTLLAVPVTIGIFTVPSPTVSLVLVGFYFFFACCYLSLPFAILQIVMPPHLRGKAASIVLVMNGVLTLGGAPVLIAVVTEALGGPAMVGQSLLICMAISLALGAVGMWLSGQPVRAILNERNTVN
ncbi:MFS transporter [Novosphingobium pentaromativorans]|nr:MFS transporter [Novosphingobium pentaromativorans]